MKLITLLLPGFLCVVAPGAAAAQEADSNPAQADTTFPQAETGAANAESPPPTETTESTEPAAADDGSAADYAASLFAESSGSEGARQTIKWSGFIEPELRSYFDRPHGGWVASAKPDARLELHVYPSDKVDGAVVGEVDLRFPSEVTPEVKGELRELWVRFYEGPFGVSAGKQIYAWGSILEFGVGDILNPQELPDLAQDAANRKIGVWSVKAAWDLEFMQAELYALPWSTPHELPFDGPFVTEGRMLPLQRAAAEDAQRAFEAITAEGFLLDPNDTEAQAAYEARLRGFRAAYEGALQTPVRDTPPRDLRGMEGAARLYFPLDFGDFSLAAARLHDRTGTMQLTPSSQTGGLPALHIEYPKVTAWTFSGAIPIGAFTLRLEELYVHTADPRGTQPFLRNPTLQSAAQLQWDPTSSWQIRTGVQDEQILKLDSPGERADEYSLPSPAGSVLLLIAPHIAHTAVTFIFGDALNQLTAAYLFSYESNGHFINPEADIGLTEGIRLKAGAQVFLGDTAKPGFGQLDDFDNVYAALRVGF